MTPVFTVARVTDYIGVYNGDTLIYEDDDIDLVHLLPKGVPFILEVLEGEGTDLDDVVFNYGGFPATLEEANDLV
jgi:hypothetical protein